MTAKIVSIAQAKGGVGKSTLCANLSVTLSQSSKVLMIDCDPPQHSLSAWYHVRDDLYVETGLSLTTAATPAQLTSLIDKNKSEYDYILIDGASGHPCVETMQQVATDYAARYNREMNRLLAQQLIPQQPQ